MKRLGTLVILAGCILFILAIARLPPEKRNILGTPEAYGYFLGMSLPYVAIIGFGIFLRSKKPD
jgi:hypothetical protein